MRTLKDPDVRRAEILDAAEQLFTTKGYGKTTIMDILNTLGIAKGTFYYYFKSKEEVMDAVIARLIQEDATRSGEIARDSSLSPLEKLSLIFRSQQPQQGDHKDKLLEQFHHPSNAEMHQKSLVQGILTIAPILTKVVREGINQGLFQTAYPAETIELLMVSGQILFDKGMFQWSESAFQSRINAFIHMMEATLGAKPGSLAFIGEIMRNQQD